MNAPLTAWRRIRAVVALYYIWLLGSAFAATGPDISKEFSIDYQIDPQAEGKNAGKTLRHTYKPDGTFFGESTGHYIYEMPTPYGATILESVDVAPNKIAQRQISLTFSEDSGGGGMMYSMDPAFGDGAGVQQFSFKFLDASKTQLQAGPRSLSIAAPLEKTVTNVESSADEAIAKLPLPPRIRQRFESFNKTKRYWGVKGHFISRDEHSTAPVTSTFAQPVARSTRLQLDGDVVPVDGRWLRYRVLYDYLKPRGGAALPDAPEALRLFSGSGLYADWLKEQSKDFDDLPGEVEDLRLILHTSAEIVATDEAELAVEHDKILAVVQSQDLLAVPILNGDQYAVLCSKLAEEEIAQRPTRSVILETDIVPTSSTRPETVYRLKNPKLGLYFVTVPAGDYNPTSGQFYDARMSAFWLSATELTRKQFQAMGMKPAHKTLHMIQEKGRELIQQLDETFLDAAVVDVSWTEATEWCRRFTEHERQAGRLPDGFIYALPSAAQSEYASKSIVDPRTASGGTTLGFTIARYPWSGGGIFKLYSRVEEMALDNLQVRKDFLRDSKIIDPVGPIGVRTDRLGNRRHEMLGIDDTALEVGIRVALRKPFPEEKLTGVSSQAAPVAYPQNAADISASNTAPAKPANSPPLAAAPASSTQGRMSGTFWKGPGRGDTLIFAEGGSFQGSAGGQTVQGSYASNSGSGEVTLTTPQGVAIYLRSADGKRLESAATIAAANPMSEVPIWTLAASVPDQAAAVTRPSTTRPNSTKVPTAAPIDNPRKSFISDTVWKSSAGDQLHFESTGDFEAVIQGQPQKGTFRRNAAGKVITTSGSRVVTYTRSTDGSQLQEESVAVNGVEAPTSDVVWVLENPNASESKP